MEVTLPGDIRIGTTQLALLWALESAFCKLNSGFISTPVTATSQPHCVQGAGLHAVSKYDAQFYPFLHEVDEKHRGGFLDVPGTGFSLPSRSASVFQKNLRICKQGLFSEAQFTLLSHKFCINKVPPSFFFSAVQQGLLSITQYMKCRLLAVSINFVYSFI